MQALSHVVRDELQEPYLITKLESAEKTWKELSVRLMDSWREQFKIDNIIVGRSFAVVSVNYEH